MLLDHPETLTDWTIKSITAHWCEEHPQLMIEVCQSTGGRASDRPLIVIHMNTIIVRDASRQSIEAEDKNGELAAGFLLYLVGA